MNSNGTWGQHCVTWGAGVTKWSGCIDDNIVFTPNSLTCFSSGILPLPGEEATKNYCIWTCSENGKQELRAKFDLGNKWRSFFNFIEHFENLLEIHDLTFFCIGGKTNSKLRAQAEGHQACEEACSLQGTETLRVNEICLNTLAVNEM
jgi:hypothetical protein